MIKPQIMKFLLTAALLSITGIGTAQGLSESKQQKQYRQLSERISERKIDLAKLESNVEEKTRKMKNATGDAQTAADDNRKAAKKLSDEPQHKAYARRAKKAARSAKRSAKKARIATDDLASLKKNIESLKNKIADDDKKLAAMSTQ
jgi:hypothetical protein